MTLKTNRLTITPIDKETATTLTQFNTYTATRSALSAQTERERSLILSELKETNALLQQLQQESNRDPKEFFGVFLGNHLIGVITFIHSHTSEPVLQVEIAPEYRRQGYGYESARGFLDDLFSRDESTVIRGYTIQERGNGGISLAKKLGGLYLLPMDNIRFLVGIWELRPSTSQQRHAI